MYIIVYNELHKILPSIAISNDLEFIFYSKAGKLSCCNWMKKFKEIGRINKIYQSTFNVPDSWFDNLSNIHRIDTFGVDFYRMYQTEIVKTNVTEFYRDVYSEIENDKTLVSLEPRFETGTIIRHFKRELVEKEHIHKYLYIYIGQVKHSETGEELALYSAMYTDKTNGITSGDMFVRPSHMFFGLVDKEKYPDIKQRYRFEATSLDKERGSINE